MADGSITVARRGREIRVADLFCGAGGLSTGASRALRALGVPMRLVGVNHWPIAIETNRRNHPEHAQRIHCAALETARPLKLVPEGSLDLLMAAPSCVFHSRARGGRPVNDQQRMDPWHVVRWCTELRVKRLLVENVPEFMDWGPCDVRTGRPIPGRKGEYFRAWIAALEAIGFRVQYRVLCAADFGDPTTRRRFFLIGCSDKRALRWPEPEYTAVAHTDLLGARKRWRAAAEIIDWSIEGGSIFTRKKPLARNTVRRIHAGAVRYCWPKPHIEALQALLDGREPVLDVPAEAMAWLGTHTGLVLATGAGGAARELDQPIPTVTAGGQGGARPQLIEPLVAPYYGGGSGLTATPATSPVPAVTTKARFGLAEAVVIQTDQTGSPGLIRDVSEPLGTVVTKQNAGLAQPFIVPNFGERDGQTPRTHAIDEPLPTVAATGHIQLAAPAVEGFRIDIRYRMLNWRELARAMSFDDEGEVYDFAGNATEITKQIGNAVPGRLAKSLVLALMGDAA
jgi:DNA (cytosine-5)-methyltransferase 1